MAAQAARARLAVGVLLDGRRQERWVAESLRRALAVPGVALCAVALVHGTRPGRRPALFRALDALDRRWGAARRLSRRANVLPDLAAPRLSVCAEPSADGWSLGQASARRLAACGADVWLCFTAAAPRRPLPPVARRGGWALVFGRGAPAADPWAGAAEIAAASPVTAIGVADWMRPAGTDLCRSIGATRHASPRRNRAAALAKGVALFARLLAALAQDGGRRWPAPPVAELPADYPAPGPATPAAARRLWLRAIATVAANRWRRLRWRERWQVAYCFRDRGGADGGWRLMEAPRGRLWADPFLLRHGDRRFVLFEDQAGGSDPGRIMAVEIFRDAGPGPPRLVLQRPYHLSYPFVFRWHGSLYLLPDTGANRTVELYRCEEFPRRWRLERTLLAGLEARDATLWAGEDRWWMFVAVAEPGADPNDELHLYWSRTPLGPWVPHRANPVVSDVRRARAAGPLFRCAGALYRPSQDSSRGYGGAVCINRVERLSEDEYRETPVGRIDPGRRPTVRGIHTVADDGEVGVIDVLVRRRRW